MTARATYHHGDLRTALLDAGDAVLRERGLQGFTLRECARRAGVSHAAPKHHFGGMQGFLTELAVRGFERLKGTLREHLDDAGADPVARMIATSRAYYAFAQRWPEHFRVMFRCDLLDIASAPFRLAARETYVELTNVVLTLRGEPTIGLDQLAATVCDADVIDDITLAWCFIHGYAHLTIEEQFDMVEDADRDAVMRRAATRLAGVLKLPAP